MPHSEVVEAVKQAREVVKTYPALRNEIEGFVELMQSEVEEGSPASHEADLCIEAINQLVSNFIS